MIKQIDRVIVNLVQQVEEFRRLGANPICIGLVGINHAEAYTSYEQDRHLPLPPHGCAKVIPLHRRSSAANGH
jgi:hypothetical protein